MWKRFNPGDTIELTIQRPQAAYLLVAKAVFRAYVFPSAEGGLLHQVSPAIVDAFPVAFLAVSLAVLFLGFDDRDAWLLAFMFAGWIAAPSFASSSAGLGPSFRAFAMAFRATFDSLLGPLFYFFFFEGGGAAALSNRSMNDPSFRAMFFQTRSRWLPL